MIIYYYGGYFNFVRLSREAQNILLQDYPRPTRRPIGGNTMKKELLVEFVFRLEMSRMIEYDRDKFKVKGEI
jgi:hypothetical protein